MTSEYHLFVLLMLLRTLAMCFIPPKVCLAFAPSLVLANTPPHGLGHGDAGPFGHIDGDGLATVPDPPPLEALHKRAQRQTHHLHGKALTRAPSPSHPKRRHPLPVALPALNLSGEMASASASSPHTPTSLCIACTLTKSIVPAGTS
jgi:hypothetical protein